MRIWNGVDEIGELRGSVVASIGNYDGVHRGHQAILEHTVADADRRCVPSLLITFDPHPVSVVAPGRTPQMLQTRRQKLESLERTGLDHVWILRFDETVATLTGEEFFDRLIGERLGFAALHVGENFRFGRDRSGDVELLRRIGSRREFDVHGVPTLRIGDETVSSSAIRQALVAGDVARAALMLGRPFVLTGEVVEGDGRGRRLDCPTANVELEGSLVPRPGVYVTETVALSARTPSVTNVGVRPTFGGDTLTLETHLLGFDDDLYHERVEVHFLERIRDEQKFDSISTLADQIARDRAAAESFFQNRRLEAT